ncbi:DUF1993 domain-containing protein [Novosphingobium pentaromativorans]|uniref:DUF1993 domain-containing protein n=1 Tax=Novosphingobium pentaromativorans US6-1 TaxID=1088721 RepID=G6E9E4_9SPHN|nr:DUF1993 domain-containing protein [Novosphingobium pentaromativorans]AIT81047.1 hypothetical protein JI59_15305 [Novosphingobium pentaromativorans US6-1]EHJ62368.1 hypothetical protein NSU_0965 [Novosphingobium pentaromativorans US6-1]
MSVSLDDAYVQTCLQILRALAGQLEKAEDHCKTAGVSPETLTEARLAPDMWPFAKQVFEAGHHSARAIEGVRAGLFGPELDPVPSDFPTLREQVAQSIATLEGVAPGELDAIADRDMRFEFKSHRMDFTVADFLLSFSLPNFFFHATTAYDLLRSQGVAIGKRDFLGQARGKA